MGESEDIRGMNIERANRIKASSNKHNIPIFTTVEITKKDQQPPTLSSIMGNPGNLLIMRQSSCFCMKIRKDRQTTRKRLILFLTMGKTNYHFTRGNNLYCLINLSQKYQKFQTTGTLWKTTTHRKKGKKGKQDKQETIWK